MVIYALFNLEEKSRMLSFCVLVLYYGQVHKQAANYKEDSSNLKTVEGSKNIRKTAAKLHAFNKYVYQDPRVEVVVLPIFDGISLIRKRVAE